ncbi:MAG: hypothetical protein AAF289_00795 [Cyanobacteria bacterium P01_A01_bin.135]
MTGSKSANVDQPLPGQLPQQPDKAPSAPASSPDEALSVSNSAQGLRHGPIPPASEPLQYRAIGLIRGVYVPSEEQFTRGHITTVDGDDIDAVLLGRVMSLVKKHVDLAQANLWVVYPRTRPGTNDLHAQIVGIWDPENLNQDDDLDGELEDDEDGDSAEALEDETLEDETPSNSELDDLPSVDDDDNADQAEEQVEATADSVKQAAGDIANAERSEPNPPLTAAPPMKPKPALAAQPAADEAPRADINDTEDGYFSIRGEVIRQARGSDDIVIKICQAPRKGEKRGRAFKLLLKGAVNRRAIGAFWDMHIQRRGNDLVIQEANFIKDMPPTKRRGRKPPRRRNAASGPPRRRQDRPTTANQQGERRPQSSPAPKPIIKRQRSSSASE